MVSSKPSRAATAGRKEGRKHLPRGCGVCARGDAEAVFIAAPETLGEISATEFGMVAS